MFGGSDGDEEDDDVVDVERWLTLGAPMGSCRVVSASVGFVIGSVAVEMVRFAIDGIHLLLGQLVLSRKVEKPVDGLAFMFDV